MPIVVTWKFVAAFVFGMGIGSLCAGLLLYATVALHRLVAIRQQNAWKADSDRRLHEALAAANMCAALHQPRAGGSDMCCICQVRRCWSSLNAPHVL